MKNVKVIKKAAIFLMVVILVQVTKCIIIVKE